MSRVPIGPGTEVTLSFQLSLPNGQLIDQTGASGATFKFADGSLLPGFEQALVGLFAGDQTLVTCLLYTSPSPRDRTRSRMPSSA